MEIIWPGLIEQDEGNRIHFLWIVTVNEKQYY